MKNYTAIGICTISFLLTCVHTSLNKLRTDRCPDFYGGRNCTESCRCANITDQGKHFEKFCEISSNGCICKPGWITANCNEACDKPYYGRACTKLCNCAPEVCHHVTGCPVTTEVTKGGTVKHSSSFVTTPEITENTTPHSGTEFKFFTILIPIIVMTSLAITICILRLCLRRSRCCQKSKTKVYTHVQSSETSTITNNITNASEYSYIDISDEVFSEARQTHSDHHPNMLGATNIYSQATTNRNVMPTNQPSWNTTENMTSLEGEYAEAFCDVDRGTVTMIMNNIPDDVKNKMQDGEYYILSKKENVYDNPNILQPTEMSSSTSEIYNKLSHSGRSHSQLNIINQYQSVSMSRNGDTMYL